MPLMKKRTLIVTTLLAVSFLAIALIAVPPLLNRFLDLDTYKAEILSQLEKSLSRKVIYERGEFTLFKGPAFSFRNIVVREKESASDFLTAKRANIRLSLFHLLQGEIVVTQLMLDNPSVSLIRYRTGEFNISDLLTGKDERTSMNISGVWLSNATIRFSDMSATPEGLKATLSETDLVLDHLAKGKKTGFKLTGTLMTTGVKSPISLNGNLHLPREGKPPGETEINAKLQAKGVPPGFFWPYYSGYVPFRKISGLFDLDLTVKGKPTDFTSSGEIVISGLRFDYPQVFHSVLTPGKVHLDYSLAWTPAAVKVKSIALKVDNLKVKGSCEVLDLNSGDPRITAKATTSTFRLEEFRGYIPYGIIVKDTADFIEQHIMGGVYRLDEGSLDGRISQILHMEKGENYNVLYIRGHVEQGLISYGDSVPTFNSIKGGLEMKGKDFILHGMKARFGTSPFSLEGKITDYPLESPCAYPFTMVMTPMQPEIAWLMGREAGKNVGFSGNSTLHLQGDGFTSSYNLSGDWDLTNAAYSYPDLIKKPAGQTNNATFKGLITNKEMKLESLRYSLSPLVLSLAANYRYTDTPWLEIDLKTNRFPVQQIAPLIPIASSYQPAGLLQASLVGESQKGTPDYLAWKGTVTMSGCSFKPAGNIRPLSAINGTISFSDHSMETSQLSARLGSSTFQGKGTMTGFKDPALKLVFSSRLLDPVDLGLTPPVKGMKVANLAANISLRENELHISTLSGRINKTAVSLKGAIHNINTTPSADISVTSPHLDVDDILLLAALEQEKPSRPVPPPTLRATVTADSVKALGIPFQKFRGSVLLENRILYIQPVKADLAGGEITGSVRIDTSASGPDRRIQVGCKLQKASAEKLMNALGVTKSELRGTIDLQGEISAKGDSAAEVKRTALGSATVRIQEGSLRRFSTLAKIFSILNISQLIKFQLPDMVSGGMPFNDITGNFSIKDGIVSTTDLYLDSDAINISAVGRYNLYRDELDATIGVKPLQTVDKVVSHIPIVGWILTGKDKSLVTAYFEAKGKLDNPEVKAIPVKGMAKGVFNIFRRIFELPGRLVTDTGEVIIGN